MSKCRQRIVVGMIGLVCGCVTACFISCTNSFTGGNSSETTNVAMISGVVVDAQGFSAGNVQVTVRPAGFDPVTDGPTPDSDMVTTGADGIYSFSVAKGRTYTIEAVHRSRRTRALLSEVTVGQDENQAPRCTLNAPGVIKVMVPGNADTARGFVFIPGTSIFSMVKFSRGFVLLDSVPVGRIPQIVYSSTNATAATLLRYNVAVTEGDTAVVGNPGWNYSRKITLNTTATGANVTGTETNFPALLRLTAANFNFTQARNNGEDIRFAKSDNTFLPYEIERWDPVAGLAEVWVKVDTVYGNDSAQAIAMYWGNIDATGQSNSVTVFDTASGFQGVWHLSEPGNAITKDATVNHYDGTPSDTAPLGVEGAIGLCRSFNGSSNFIRMNGTANSKLNFPENGIYTVSAWAYAEAIDYGSHLVVGKSNEQYAMKFKFSLQNSPMVWEFTEYRDSLDWCSTNSLPIVPSAKKWTHIAGVRNGTAQYFFLNGELVDSSISVSSGSRPAAEDVTIGRFLSVSAYTIEGICPFLGMIDEVRISNVACSADWIKLCYMNQKEQDVLVKW